MGGPVWRLGERAFDCSERTLVMGILNITPDSFSENGRFFDPEEAVRHASQMVSDGADVVDVGGESTRPGSEPVPADEEMRRVMPIIERIVLQNSDVPISIDTRKAEVADRALAAGATIVNDVSAAGDPRMFDVVRKHGAGIVLMHMQGEPKTMQEVPEYEDVVGEVHEFLRERIEAAEFAGIGAERIAIDPGIGFGKNLDHNFELMRRIDAFLDLGRPVLVGPSRKRFIGAILDVAEDERIEGTIGAVSWLVSRGAHVVRVHDVREVARAVRVIDAIVRAGR